MKNEIKAMTSILLILVLSNCKVSTSLQYERDNLDIIYESKGDLNLDGIEDLAIISGDGDNEKGIITILITDTKGNVSRKLVNENITDEYIELYAKLPEIEIKKGELIISYYGGMCHRESRNFIFKFNKELNNLFFETFTTSEHNVCNDNEPIENEITSAELKKIKFTEFNGYLEIE